MIAPTTLPVPPAVSVPVLVPCCDFDFNQFAAVRDVRCGKPVWFPAEGSLTLWANHVLAVRAVKLASEGGHHRVALPGGKEAWVGVVHEVAVADIPAEVAA